ncbi:MAG: hypothetical protein RLZZ458_1022, partial [Planctomycetota bacterium]
MSAIPNSFATYGFVPAAFTAVDAAAARFRAAASPARVLGFMKAGAFGRLQNRPKKLLPSSVLPEVPPTAGFTEFGSTRLNAFSEPVNGPEFTP